MTGQQLKNSILQEAIEGRLVPQDPNDEPASVLLERIRAEKARLVKEKKIKKTVLNEKDVAEEEKIFDSPDTWEWCKIETIFQHSSGKQLKGGDTEGTLHQYITTSNLYWDRFVLDNLKSMYYKDSELDRCTAQKGDLLVCEGGDVGRSAIWPYDFNICLQNHVHRLRPYFDGYTRYVFYVIWLYKSIGLIGGKGIGIKGFSASALKDISIPLPPLAEQHRIVEKIESLLPKVEAYGKAQEELVKLTEALPEQLKKSILQEAIAGRLVPQDPNDEPASALLERIREEKARLVKEKKIKKSVLKEEALSDEDILFDIPDNWEWCKLGWIGDWGAGATPAKGNTEYYINGTVPWLRTGELNNSYVYDSEIKVTQKALDECSLRPCKIGDVLIAMYGATIGKVAIAGIELTTNQACCACTPFEVYNKYLLYYLMACKDRFIQLGEGGAQPNISREKIVAFPFSLPPLAEQHRIVEKIESLLPKIEKLKMKQ